MPDIGTYQRATMARKLEVIPLPELADRSVLDVGCDHGAWCWLAAERGASFVMGLDRGRDGVDLARRNTEVNPYAACLFRTLEVGRQWPCLQRFDLVLCLNVYHHIYEVCGDHPAIWFWLWRHTNGQLLWEAPLDRRDPVVQMNLSRPYEADEIVGAAGLYFDLEPIGEGHVGTRVVWRCWPKTLPRIEYGCELRHGAGGATPAFEYAGGRRMDELERILGVRPIPGSLNLKADKAFHWDARYYRAELLDVAERGRGLDVEWKPRPVRLYPLTWNEVPCWALRFEGESYPLDFVELIAARRLREISGAVLAG